MQVWLVMTNMTAGDGESWECTQEQGVTLSHTSLVEGLEAGWAALHMPKLATPEGPHRQPPGPFWADDRHQSSIDGKFGEACCQLLQAVTPPHHLPITCAFTCSPHTTCVHKGQ